MFPPADLCRKKKRNGKDQEDEKEEQVGYRTNRNAVQNGIPENKGE